MRLGNPSPHNPVTLFGTEDRLTHTHIHTHTLMNSGVRIHQRIIILDTLRVFYLVQRKHLLNLNNLKTRSISNPFSKNVWIWTMD